MKVSWNSDLRGISENWVGLGPALNLFSKFAWSSSNFKVILCSSGFIIRGQVISSNFIISKFYFFRN